jgi:N-acetylglucosamine malate deacetylase 1
MNPYYSLVAEYARLRQEGKSYQLGGYPPAPRPEVAPDAAKVLVFAPHPDDECIIGGLPLRLLRECKMNVINVAVTQGSNKERQQERLRELKAACDYIGFGLAQTAPDGLEKVNLKTRENDPAHWAECVKVIAEILEQHRPHIIFFPHDQDWNSTHIGTHYLVIEALESLPRPFNCCLVETEFWGQMMTPNLMVESNVQDVSDLVTATSFHAGEVKRNPYHLLMAAWMQDNVRRGSELVGGQGGVAPEFGFATLYRLRRWQDGKAQRIYEGGRNLPETENPSALFR